MKVSKLFFTCIILLSILVLSSNAQAIPITYEFTANIKWTNGSALLNNFVAVGDNFTGRFSYDTEATPTQFTSSNFYIYSFDPVLYGVNLSIGPAGSFTNPAYNIFNYYHIGITTNFGGYPAGAHGLNVATMSQPAPTGWPSGPRINFQLTLLDSTATAFLNNNLPMDLDLLDFDTRRIVMENVFGNKWRFDSEITRLERVSPSPIPEPTTFLLLGVGAFFIVILKREIMRA